MLLRRLSLDLIGLPPTREELAAFEADDVAGLVREGRSIGCWPTRSTASAGAGTGWTSGATATGGDSATEVRNSQKHIWHWRDWIVESLNADKGYDQMVREMLAADELYPDDLDRLRATGFLARNYFMFNRNQWMDETVEHVGKGFLGLTMNCAKCHDHKYDPIAQVDYYRMRAFFEPYQVRLDVVPGEADLAQDGIPRVFDGILDAPTYRFIRGDESQPGQVRADRARRAGAARVRAAARSSPSTLPPEAWQPERRAVGGRGLPEAAQRKIAAAEARLGCRERSSTAAERGPAESDARLRSRPGWQMRVAELQLAAARAELQSVERRAEAMRAAWDRSSSRNAGPGRPRRSASGPRRRSRGARARGRSSAELPLAEAELRLASRGRGQEGGDREGSRRGARGAGQGRQVGRGAGRDATRRCAGAQWTPTRFLNSAKDDPEVDLPADQHRPPHGAGRVDHRPPQSADGPRRRQPHLDAALRHAAGADGLRLRPQGDARRRIPNCSTGWRSSSSSTAGA